jgi:hypothetical protein
MSKEYDNLSELLEKLKDPEFAEQYKKGWDFSHYKSMVFDPNKKKWTEEPDPIMDEFAKRWGLKIEERELSHDERVKIACKQENGIIPVVPMYGDWDPTKEKMNQFLNEKNIPTKLITITYNDKKIESYES